MSPGVLEIRVCPNKFNTACMLLISDFILRFLKIYIKSSGGSIAVTYGSKMMPTIL